MSHPPTSYLSPAQLELALDLARLLREASEEIRVLSLGTSGSGGRAGDAALAMRHWIGPHRDTFERLHADEQASAVTARNRLDDEADAWARFWADATDARQQRLHDEAMADHRLAEANYRREFDAWSEAISADPASTIHLATPIRPQPPAAPSPVVVPTAADDYRPTS